MQGVLVNDFSVCSELLPESQSQSHKARLFPALLGLAPNENCPSVNGVDFVRRYNIIIRKPHNDHGPGFICEIPVKHLAAVSVTI